MSELLAVEGLTLDHMDGSVISGGSFTIMSTPDVKAKAEGHGIYATPLDFTFKEGNAKGFQDGSVSGGGSIPATATKTKIGGVLVMREGDSVLMDCVGTYEPPPAPPASPTGPVSGMVEIADAGQTKAKAN